MTDLTADRGAALNPLMADAQEITNGGGDPFGLIAGLKDMKGFDDDEEEEDTDAKKPEPEDEKDPDDDEEEADPDDKKTDDDEGVESVTIEGLGTLTVEDIEAAVEARDRLEELEPQIEALIQQSTEFEAIQSQLEGAMSFQRAFEIPAVAQAVNAALAQLFQTQPVVGMQFQRAFMQAGAQRQQAQAPQRGQGPDQALAARLEKMETRVFERDKAEAGAKLDGMFKGYADKYGPAWNERLEKKYLGDAIKRYGDRLSEEVLTDFIDAQIHRAGMKAVTRPVSSPEQLSKALAKAPAGSRILPVGNSKRQANGNSMPDTTKMDKKTFDRYFQSRIGR